jgi:hypothetical protein
MPGKKQKQKQEVVTAQRQHFVVIKFKAKRFGPEAVDTLKYTVHSLKTAVHFPLVARAFQTGHHLPVLIEIPYLFANSTSPVNLTFHPENKHFVR